MNCFKYYILDKKIINKKDLVNKIYIKKINNSYNDNSVKELLVNLLLIISSFNFTDGVKFVINDIDSFFDYDYITSFDDYIVNKISNDFENEKREKLNKDSLISKYKEGIYETIKDNFDVSFFSNVEANEFYSTGHF